MRKAFISTLIALAQKNPQIVLLTADLGFNVLETFRESLPKQYINVGVSEQNSIAMATGLAMKGFIPFVYSITPFVTLRALEFIRNGPVVHQLPVRIIGIGAGMEYGFDGLTHFSLEDIGVLRLLNHIRVVSPATSEQAASSLNLTWNLEGPTYYRISKSEMPNQPALSKYQDITLIRHGHDALIFTYGALIHEVLKATDSLEHEGIHCAVAVIATLHPIDRQLLSFLMSGYHHIFSIEMHARTGGLGSILSEVITDTGLHSILTRCGYTFHASQLLGTSQYLNAQHGLSSEEMLKTIKEKVKSL